MLKNSVYHNIYSQLEGKQMDSCFPRALVQSEMQTVASWIWSLVTDSISYDDNCYPIALS